ncbi:MAG: lysophospholipase [Lachnospiraceae bacterium]|nr:lysophospholipase [Lachnospiraceae bacterium]
MKETSYIHNSGSDGLPLSVFRTEPDDPAEIKGIVQLVHGMNEYKERYLPFMEYLTGSGYITVIHDHRGHGHSIKSADDLGYFYEGGYMALVEDIHEITLDTKEYAQKLTGKSDLPLILFGHSMGSLAVRCYIRQYDSDIDKLIVCGCPSYNPAAKPGLLLVKLFKKIKGERNRSMFIAGLVMGSYEKRFQKEGVPHSWINSDLDAVRTYGADPLCNYLFTLNGFENLVRLTILTYTDGGYTMKNPKLPIRFYSGADDPCAVDERSFNAAVELLKKQGYTDVRGKMYKNMRHEILNEPEHQKVFDDMMQFIQA